MADTATMREYVVDGMTCQHCVTAITEDVTAVPGVTEVQVDLAAGRVKVSSDSQFDDAAVRAAIEEAGYEVGG
jgi:copper ion binding protein